MRQLLVETELGTALLITDEMKQGLGIDTEVDVVMETGRAVLRKPITIAEASRKSDERFAEAYRELAK